ncbi:hypothetical protein ACFL0F_02230 [Patescibacteria group bacterium]
MTIATTPSEYFNPDDNYFLKRFFANRVVSGESDSFSEEYKNYSEDYLLLPLWVEERSDILPDARIESSMAKSNDNSEISAVKLQTVIELDEEGEVNIHKYYYPGWEVKVNGEITKPEISKPHGYMTLNLNSGKHAIEVYWKETTKRIVFDVISIISLVVLTVLIIRNKPLWIKK